MTDSKNDVTVDAKLLDTKQSKYDLVKLAVMHVNALKRTQELSGWHVPQLIKKSLDDIVSGTADAEEIMAVNKKHLAEADKPAGVIPAPASEKKHSAEADDKETKKSAPKKSKS